MYTLCCGHQISPHCDKMPDFGYIFSIPTRGNSILCESMTAMTKQNLYFVMVT